MATELFELHRDGHHLRAKPVSKAPKLAAKKAVKVVVDPAKP